MRWRKLASSAASALRLCSATIKNPVPIIKTVSASTKSAVRRPRSVRRPRRKRREVSDRFAVGWWAVVVIVETTTLM